MSVVTVQLGQCGNQIGSAFFTTLMYNLKSDKHVGEYESSALNCFFNCTENGSVLKYQARAVLVDMESKVVDQINEDAIKSNTWYYSSEDHFTQKTGSGNNWAHGYNVHGPKVRDNISNIVRKVVESCDYFDGFLTVQSLAGGTGSGLGTFVNEILRDEFPNSFILNQVVSPYTTGEVSVQNYNALFTLSHLHHTSDGIILFENDNIHKICEKKLNLFDVNFKNMNNIIAHKMASMYLPATDDERDSGLIPNPLGYIIRNMCFHPEYKLMRLKSIPFISKACQHFSSSTWNGILKHLRQMLISNTHMEHGIDWQIKASETQCNFTRSLSNLLYIRGNGALDADVEGFKSTFLYKSWSTKNPMIHIARDVRMINDNEKCASLLSNNPSIVSCLEDILEKSWKMFTVKAFMHQYTKHGISEDDFIDSFATLEQTIANYKKI